MHIIVTGGGGAMGRIAVRTLLEMEDVDQVTIADYSEERAHEVAAALNSSKIQVRQIDVNDEERLRGLLRGADALLNAVEYVFNLPVLRACIKERVHYADLGGLFHMTRKLLTMHAEAEAAGITAIVGMGGTPGVTNLLARLAVDRLDRVDSIQVQLGCSAATPVIRSGGDGLPGTGRARHRRLLAALGVRHFPALLPRQGYPARLIQDRLPRRLHDEAQI